MSRLVCEETEGKLSHGIQQKAAEYRMGGNLGSKEIKQTTKPTRIIFMAPPIIPVHLWVREGSIATGKHKNRMESTRLQPSDSTEELPRN